MKLTDFKVLTFDVVGTLIDFEKGILDAVRKIGGEVAKQYSDDQIFTAYKAGRDKFPGRSSQEMANVYLHLAKELDLPSGASDADAFQMAVLRWPPFADAAEAMKRLRKNFRLVAMTNADRTAFTAYNEALGRPFHDSVTCDETGVAKPNPEYFAYNKGRQFAFGYPQNEILHVAQSQYHDIGVAHSLGYTTCWIERRHDQAGYGGTPDPKEFTEPDFHFTSMKELADAVDKEL